MSKVILTLVILLFVSFEVKAGDKEDKEKIKVLIDNILKRKDIDKIKKTIAANAQIYIDGSAYNLTELIDQNEKDRALGTGSYEEINTIDITIKDDLAYVMMTSKYTGRRVKEGLLSSKIVDITVSQLNTVILENNKSWKIVHWHTSTTREN